jgi:hypothetical protein
MIIPEDICNFLEATQVDLEGTKDLIAFLARDGLVKKEVLDYYKEQYDELYIKYSLAKKEISDEWNNGDVNWKLDYSTGELTPLRGCFCAKE